MLQQDCYLVRAVEYLKGFYYLELVRTGSKGRMNRTNKILYSKSKQRQVRLTQQVLAAHNAAIHSWCV